MHCLRITDTCGMLAQRLGTGKGKGRNENRPLVFLGFILVEWRLDTLGSPNLFMEMAF